MTCKIKVVCSSAINLFISPWLQDEPQVPLLLFNVWGIKYRNRWAGDQAMDGDWEGDQAMDGDWEGDQAMDGDWEGDQVMGWDLARSNMSCVLYMVSVCEQDG